MRRTVFKATTPSTEDTFTLQTALTRKDAVTRAFNSHAKKVFHIVKQERDFGAAFVCRADYLITWLGLKVHFQPQTPAAVTVCVLHPQTPAAVTCVRVCMYYCDCVRVRICVCVCMWENVSVSFSCCWHFPSLTEDKHQPGAACLSVCQLGSHGAPISPPTPDQTLAPSLQSGALIPGSYSLTVSDP